MHSAENLRWFLTELLETTAGAAALRSPEFWRIGESEFYKPRDGAAEIRPRRFWSGRAEECRLRDDAKFGRLNMGWAHRLAVLGIEALDYGENHDAERFYEAAKGQYILALEARMRPSDWANLGKMAGKRGRPRKIEKSVAPARKRGRPKKINR